LATQGVDVDVFTRCRGRGAPQEQELSAGSRIIQVKAGPCEPVPKGDLPRFLPEFLGGVLRTERRERRGYDLVHSHYWLSGWVGRSAKEIWGVPLVASFHTLGKVKNYSLARGESPEPGARLAGEEAVISEADRIMAATPAEAAQLVGLYRADPDPTRSAGRRPRTVLPPPQRRGQGAAAPDRRAARPVRREAAAAQGARHRRPRSRRGHRPRPLAHRGRGAGRRRRAERLQPRCRGGQAHGPCLRPRRGGAGGLLPTAAAGPPGGFLRGGGMPAGAVAVRVLRAGRARGTGVRNPGGRRGRRRSSVRGAGRHDGVPGGRPRSRRSRRTAPAGSARPGRVPASWRGGRGAVAQVLLGRDSRGDPGRVPGAARRPHPAVLSPPGPSRSGGRTGRTRRNRCTATRSSIGSFLVTLSAEAATSTYDS